MPDYSKFPVTDGVITYLAAPEGYDVDFDNPKQQHNVALYTIVGTGNVLCLLFLYQRIYTKLVIVKLFQVEDVFLLMCWLCSVIVQAVTIWSVGIQARGVHGWEQPIERYVLFKISVYIGGSVFMPCASFAKVALLLFYLRLSPQIWFRNAIWATLGLIACYTPGIFFALLFACNPINSSWNVDVKGKCINTTALFIATCVVNITTDVILFLLPIPTVLRLKMPLSQRLGVLALFSVGLVTIITSVVRAAILPQMSGPDQSWVTAQASIWSQLECNLLVICGTIPTIPKFFGHVAPSLFGSSARKSKPSGGGATPNYDSSNRRPPRNRRNPYAKFGAKDTDFELSRWEGAEDSKDTTPTVVISGDPPPASEDDNSERAIIVTREVTVTRP